MLGASSKQAGPPELLSAGGRALTSRVMLAGGNESTQWFEVSVVTSSTTRVVIHATINTVLIVPATVGTLLFHEVTIQGTDKTNFPGSPRLPVISLIVAVDYQREVNLSMTATGATTETEVLPIPGQYTDDMMDLVPRPFLMDHDIYTGGGYYPGVTGTISLPIIHGGIRCVHLNLLPIQCKPTDATITMYHSLTATLTYGAISTINPLQQRPQYVAAMFEEPLKQSIVNYAQQGLQTALPQGIRLLAIIAEDYWNNAAVQHLLDWHDYEGLKTYRIKAPRNFTITPGSAFENDRRARHAQRDSIRSTIQNLYNSEKDQGLSTLTFVMLVGDVDPQGGVIQQGPTNGHVVLNPKFLSWFDWDDYTQQMFQKNGQPYSPPRYQGYYNLYGWYNWYQGDAGYSFQLNGSPGIDVAICRITGQMYGSNGTNEITRVCYHSLGYATYQNNLITSSEGWPTTAYGFDLAPQQGYHWLSKVNITGFKYDPVSQDETWNWRFVRRSYRLWDKINGLAGAPADVTLINGQFERDNPPAQMLPAGNDAVMYGRPDGQHYFYQFKDDSGSSVPPISMSPRVNRWTVDQNGTGGLGLFFYTGHGNKCKWPCWNKIDEPRKPDCIYCYESYWKKWADEVCPGYPWGDPGCPCGSGTSIATACTYMCGQDFNCSGQFDALQNGYKTPVVMSFSCLTAALKQIGSYPCNAMSDWGHWGFHWRWVGAWNCPANEAECNCQGNYVVDDCYGSGTCSEFPGEVHGSPIGERAVASYNPSTGAGGGAIAWFGTAGVLAAPDDIVSFYTNIVGGIWPSTLNYQSRLGLITRAALMGLFGDGVVLDPDAFSLPTRQLMWIGDCALDVRTKYPMSLSLVPSPDSIYHHPADFAQARQIAVSAGGQPAVGALLCLCQGLKGIDGNWSWTVYCVRMADQNGVVHIPAISGVQPGLIRIVASRHNCRPALFWITLT